MGSGLSGGPLTGSPLATTLAPGATGTDLTLSGDLTADQIQTGAGAVSAVAVGPAGDMDTGIYWSALNTFNLATGGTLRLTISATGAAVFTGSLSIPTSTLLSIGGTTLYELPAGILNISAMIAQPGTDSTGTPGNATINKATGKSSIALGAASVTITNSLCSAASRVMITPHARDATCVDLIAVPGAGSFVVSGAAAATADLPFSWEVSNII